MKTLKEKVLAACVAAAALSLLSGCGGWWRSGGPTRAASSPPPAAAPLPADESEGTIRWLEARVKDDPQDFIAHNKLAGYYLARQRETGDASYLELAARAARASLAVIPPDQNPGALAALAQSENALHDFAAAREHALELVRIAPDKSYSFQTLGDALLELGDYKGAGEAFARMRNTGGESAGAESRLARLAFLKGDTGGALRRMTKALSLAAEQTPPNRETVAWCRWQLGELAFSEGDYATAEGHYRDALTTFPDYRHALASLGRARAAQGDLSGAIEQYERAVKVIPDPAYLAALGDLYRLAGREREAAAQFSLVEQIARASARNGALYNRQLALFYADHDLKAEEAYALAKREYEVRRDIYGADALAWAALKAGKVQEARAAMAEALRLGTRDARLLYHAGMIERAAGDRAAGDGHLKRALALNPRFDPLQSALARKALESQ
jgi:tetratricopeptide (TPR) repeat protein